MAPDTRNGLSLNVWQRSVIALHKGSMKYQHYFKFFPFITEELGVLFLDGSQKSSTLFPYLLFCWRDQPRPLLLWMDGKIMTEG